MNNLALYSNGFQRVNRREQRIASFKMHFEEVTKNSQIVKIADFIHHGGTNRYLHSVAVAYYSYRLAKLLHMRKNIRDVVRGATVHDYFLYNSKARLPEYRGHMTLHPDIALMNAEQEFMLTDVERDIIRNHMFPLTTRLPRHKEAFVVSLIDKLCAVYEFVKRKNPYPLISSQILNDTAIPQMLLPAAVAVD